MDGNHLSFCILVITALSVAVVPPQGAVALDGSAGGVRGGIEARIFGDHQDSGLDQQRLKAIEKFAAKLETVGTAALLDLVYSDALSESRRLYGLNSSQYRKIMQQAFNCYMRKHEFARGESLCRADLETLRAEVRLAKSARLEYASAISEDLHLLATLKIKEKKIPEAVSLELESIAALEPFAETNKERLAILHKTTADMLSSQGKSKQGIEHFNKVLELTNDKSLMRLALLLRSNLQRASKDYDGSLNSLRRADAIRAQLGIRDDGTCDFELARTYLQAEKLENAISYYKSALRKMEPRHHSTTSIVLAEIGTTFARMEKTAEADAYFRKCIDYSLANPDSHRTVLIDSLLAVADHECGNKQFSEARKHYKLAMEVAAKLPYNAPLSRAWLVYCNSFSFSKSAEDRASYEQLKDFIDKGSKKDPSKWWRAYGRVGEVAILRDELADAERAFEKALHGAAGVKNVDSARLEYLYRLALLQVYQGKAEDADPWIRKAETLTRQGRSLSPESMAGFYDSMHCISWFRGRDEHDYVRLGSKTRTQAGKSPRQHLLILLDYVSLKFPDGKIAISADLACANRVLDGMRNTVGDNFLFAATTKLVASEFALCGMNSEASALLKRANEAKALAFKQGSR